VAAAGVIRAGTLESGILLEMFLFGVALAVAAVPEGLPAVVTATLALGMQRLARRNAIVRSLPAVEALGSATVICTDKTGTLTRNEMTVRRILVGSRRTVEVTGHGYGAEGGFRWEEEAPDEAGAHEQLARLLALAALDNDASLVRRGAEVEAHGDPTEVALLVAAAKAGIEVEELRRRRPRRGEIPFSSARRRMTTVHDLDDGPTAVMKGAPEVVLERCTRIREAGEVRELDAGTREEIEARNEAFAGRALRTLAVASRPVEAREAGGPGAAGDPDPETVEREMVFEGLVGMLDPPREASAPSVRTAARAGIRTLMVTGDHVATARAIAREVGIGDPGDPDGPEGPGVLSGREVAALEPAELQEAVGRCSVFGRVDPETKFAIVRALQARGEVVAMTGDGVNDAPAVKTADIGVAMGRTGTDVTREAGDIVLADDDYATIVAAVEEGRTIFSNLRKFIRYLLSANAGEVLTILGAVAAAGALGLRDPGGGFLLPLLPVQILWINLVTDGPPALALGVSPPEPGIMEAPPRDPDAPVLGARMWTFVLVSGLTIMVGTLGVLDAYLPGGWIDLPGLVSPDDPVRRARTMAFTTLVMFQVAHVFNCLSQDRSVFRSRVPSNGWLLAAVALSLVLHAAVLAVPVLRTAFDTVPLGPREWAVASGVALSVVAVSELLKLTPWMKGRR
jgi:Ca2+-transporting ATPase